MIIVSAVPQKDPSPLDWITFDVEEYMNKCYEYRCDIYRLQTNIMNLMAFEGNWKQLPEDYYDMLVQQYRMEAHENEMKFHRKCENEQQALEQYIISLEIKEMALEFKLFM